MSPHPELSALKSEIAAGNELARMKELFDGLFDKLCLARAHMRNQREAILERDEVIRRQRRTIERQAAMIGKGQLFRDPLAGLRPHRAAEDEGCSD